ncbi:E3 SUMO-protein ligase ZBED1-like [Patiria miniata]|uniref:BED-type domain-containing protein n=1 Tax=Patiria miniata TaxID=46514 RepID=A0A914AFD5_PATMI|nr:E3 SUMO-protein ligase ZBED1-like [Patiria miniata]
MADLADVAEIRLVAKKKTKSVVWNYFGFEPNEDGAPKNENEAICRLCRKKVAAKQGNTSNLLAHVRANHPATHARITTGKQRATDAASRSSAGLGVDPGASTSTESTASTSVKQGTIKDAFSRATKYSRQSSRWKELTDSVTHFLAKEMLPFYTVEKRGFKAMLSKFDRQYELPGRRHFSKVAIPQLYTQVRSRVEDEMREADFFSATTDMWSSSNMEPYMSFTIHFISPDWKLQSRCLDTSFLPESHTAENLANALRSTLTQWNLPVSKLSCITTDNGANIVAAIRQLQWPWLNCFGHNLNLGVTRAITDEPQRQRTSRALGLCRSIVGSFSHSWSLKKELTKTQGNLNLPEHSLITVGTH